jgi:hypothetical protein
MKTYEGARGDTHSNAGRRAHRCSVFYRAQALVFRGCTFGVAIHG